MKIAFLVVGVLFLVPALGSRCLFLVRGRLGWLTYLCCLVNETAQKRLSIARAAADWVQVAAGLGCFALAGLPPSALLGVLVLVLGADVLVRAWDEQILRSAYVEAGKADTAPSLSRGADSERFEYLDPSVDADLTVTLRGPFVERWPVYRLRTLFTGQDLLLRAIVANHTQVALQTPVRTTVDPGGGFELGCDREQVLPRLRSGEVGEWIVRLRPVQVRGPGRLRLVLRWGQREVTLEVRYDGVEESSRHEVTRATVSRYPGGCRSAFAWRGDMDLYDEVTLQSIEGLKEAFGLAARYRMPQTLFLSTRLSLDEEAARKYAEWFGVDRGANRIPAFVAWLRENVEWRHSSPYPYLSSKPYVVELGNHGHLHFGTDAAAAEENGWKRKARMGAGRYQWLGAESGSFAEQRDNARRAADECQRFLGVRPRSWAMPDRTRDEHTASAMEAVGCEVLSDSDVRTRENVVFQPPPHHPPGTRTVELTKRYPGDPLDVFHVAMNCFWFHRAHRLGIPVVFMCHQHLRLYESRACAPYTEYLLRYVLHEFNGDLFIDTVFGVGKYWREVLSDSTRSVTVRLEGNDVVVENGSDQAFDEIPVDLETRGGARFTKLVAVPAGGSVRTSVFA